MGHYAFMVTFNQQGQHVHGPQNNAETINISQVGQQAVARELSVALSRLQGLELDEPTRREATAELEAAGADIQTGNASRAKSRLDRISAMGSALAEIAGSFVRGTGVLGG